MEFCFVNTICIIIILLLWVISAKKFASFIMHFIFNNKSTGITFDNSFFQDKEDGTRVSPMGFFFFNDFFLYISVMHSEQTTNW